MSNLFYLAPNFAALARKQQALAQAIRAAGFTVLADPSIEAERGQILVQGQSACRDVLVRHVLRELGYVPDGDGAWSESGPDSGWAVALQTINEEWTSVTILGCWATVSPLAQLGHLLKSVFWGRQIAVDGVPYMYQVGIPHPIAGSPVIVKALTELGWTVSAHATRAARPYWTARSTEPEHHNLQISYSVGVSGPTLNLIQVAPCSQL